MNLKPFQVKGVAALREIMSRQRGALLADDMGLGKTAQAIALISGAPPANVLVVCPASLVLNWAQEIMAWLPLAWVQTGLTGPPQSCDPMWYITSYDRMLRDVDALIAWKPKFVVADESHYLKNPDAKRTKAFFRIPATRRLFISGTPAMNRPIELWTTLRACGALLKQYAAHHDFGMRFCSGFLDERGQWDYRGASNLDELRAILARVMVRRTKAEVLPELGPKTRQIIPLDGPKSLLAAERSAVEEAGGWDVVCAKLEAGLSVGMDRLAQVRHELGLAKVDDAIAHIKDVLATERQVVVFAHHLDVLESLRTGLGGYGVAFVHGGVPPAKRQALKDRFQAGGTRVFLGQIQAAGVGITLTAAQVAIIVEPTYVPAELDQAEDRVHRIGQEGNVLIQYLVFDGSLDARMLQRGTHKRRILGRLGL